MPTETGIFTKEEAASGHLFSYKLAKYIGELFNFLDRRIYDMGAGTGEYCRYLEDIGFRNVVGIEGTKGLSFENGLMLEQDLTVPFEYYDKEKGHVICIEVGEHIPEELESVFLDNICKHVKQDAYLIISWAHEGQQGYGHVNCKPSWYVEQAFAIRGFELLKGVTESIRKTPEGHVAYLRENLFVFKKI